MRQLRYCAAHPLTGRYDFQVRLIVNKHRLVLEDVVSGKLQGGVCDQTYAHIREFIQLYEQRYISAINASGDTGLNYLEPKITFRGEQYLKSLDKPELRWWHKFESRIAVLGLIIALLSLLAAVKLL